MLNYIWMGLIAIGILTAVGSDVRDEIVNPYGNGKSLGGVLEGWTHEAAAMRSWEGNVLISASAFREAYGRDPGGPVRVKAKVTFGSEGGSAILIPVGSDTPEPWKTMASAGTVRDRLSGTVTMRDANTGAVAFVLEPVRFVKLRAVTRAALDYAGTAVTIALGLIGIMALWLGVMKVAEEAGVVRILTRILEPLTKRLFPEVPRDHPALGAMIMNMAANMLGLSNAATPFGLKAMEELNKLNPKAGTATNAMCTFLAINTAGLVLIPATAIAVRAAAGSVNPGVIIGTSIFGAGCATVAGVLAVKVLQRMPRFRRDDPDRMETEGSHG